jgi:hypothetical protein
MHRVSLSRRPLIAIVRRRRAERFRGLQLPHFARWLEAGHRRRRYVDAINLTAQPTFCSTGIDGHVRVWSTEAIFNADNPNYGKPRQLCHMSHHLGTIHSVRFSPNGRYLASGADDRVICIYQLDSNPPSHAATFGMDHRSRRDQSQSIG